MMDNGERNTDPVLEILDGGNATEWSIAPGEPSEHIICIRNGTSDAHDVEVSIADAVDWAWVTPARVALGPGEDASTILMLALPADAAVAAGNHTLTIELRDFEGTRFGQFVGSVQVRPRYDLEMSLRVRGPLMRGGTVEGFILVCTLLNRGNDECVALPRGDEAGIFTIHAPQVRVPLHGDVSFDVEVRWDLSRLREYPAEVTVIAGHPQGEVRACVPWADIADNLGPFLPRLEEDEGFPDAVSWLPFGLAATVEAGSTGHQMQVTASPPPTAPKPPATDEPEPSPPLRMQLTQPRGLKYTYGRRVNPWWPPAERFGGRWRIKLLPVIAAVLLVAAAAGIREMGDRFIAPLAPGTTIREVRRPPARRANVRVAATKHHARSRAKRRTGIASKPGSTAHPASARGASSDVQAVPAPNIRPKEPAHVPRGAVWQGPVIHVSAGNIKVYSRSDKSTRSFIVSQNFKGVFSADGTISYPMSYVRSGTIVRVFYSYQFGLRRPNAIFILKVAPR